MVRIAATLCTAFVAALTLGGTSVAVASGGAAHSRLHGAERFVFMDSSAKSDLFSVIATGSFTDGGSVNIVSGRPEIKLGAGELRLHTHLSRSGRKFSKATCLLTITAHGTYRLSGGTGKYRGISGSGSFITSGRELFSRTATGKCATSRTLAFQGTVTLKGSVTAS
jgi:hypothetical protein